MSSAFVCLSTISRIRRTVSKIGRAMSVTVRPVLQSMKLLITCSTQDPQTILHRPTVAKVVLQHLNRSFLSSTKDAHDKILVSRSKVQ